MAKATLLAAMIGLVTILGATGVRAGEGVEIGVAGSFSSTGHGTLEDPFGFTVRAAKTLSPAVSLEASFSYSRNELDRYGVYPIGLLRPEYEPVYENLTGWTDAKLFDAVLTFRVAQAGSMETRMGAGLGVVALSMRLRGDSTGIDRSWDQATMQFTALGTLAWTQIGQLPVGARFTGRYRAIPGHGETLDAYMPLEEGFSMFTAEVELYYRF